MTKTVHKPLLRCGRGQRGRGMKSRGHRLKGVGSGGQGLKGLGPGVLGVARCRGGAIKGVDV